MIARPLTEPVRRRRRARLTDRQVAALPRKRRRYFHPDPELPGHGVRVYPDGPSAFYVIVRDAFKKQRWVRIAGTAELSIEDSRERARSVMRRLKDGLAPFEPPPAKPDTIADVVQTWLRRHVEKKGLRTAPEIKRVLERHVLPVWRNRRFAEIKRSDIAHLLDVVEDAHSAAVADSVLSALRSVASFYASRHDTYVPPFVKGMRRVPKDDRKRERVLSDLELRKVWRAAEAEDSSRSRLLRVLLLCGQRLGKVATMKWDALSEDGVWTISTEAREKGNAGKLKLPPAAMAILNAQPRFVNNPYVFAGRRPGAPISGFTPWHTAFKQRCGVENFTLHDCRRTARSLLSRIVPPRVAEAVLGHAIPGVEGVYDQYDYFPEKAHALAALAGLIEEIVRNEPGGKIVRLRTGVVVP